MAVAAGLPVRPRPASNPSTCPPWMCPGHYDPAKTNDCGRYRGRCRADLRDADVSGRVDQAMLAAQEHVLHLASATARGDQATQRCGGLTVPNELALEAVLDLIHAQLGTHPHLTSPAAWAGRTARALPNAVSIVEQPTPTDVHAAALRLGLLRPQDPQAPIGPTQLIRARPHNRALESVTLLAMQGRLSIDNDLKFRLGAALPATRPSSVTLATPGTFTLIRTFLSCRYHPSRR